MKSFTRTTQLKAGEYTLKNILKFGYGFDDQRAVNTIKAQELSINGEIPTKQNFLKKVKLNAGDRITVQIGWGAYNVDVVE